MDGLRLRFNTEYKTRSPDIDEKYMKNVLPLQ